MILVPTGIDSITLAGQWSCTAAKVVEACLLPMSSTWKVTKSIILTGQLCFQLRQAANSREGEHAEREVEGLLPRKEVDKAATGSAQEDQNVQAKSSTVYTYEQAVDDDIEYAVLVPQRMIEASKGTYERSVALLITQRPQDLAYKGERQQMHAEKVQVRRCASEQPVGCGQRHRIQQIL
jgi:hypothetical protein